MRDAAKLILRAERPVIYAGTGIHWSRAWPQLRRLAELTGIPVLTSLGGKSGFPEDHPLSLGSGGVAYPKAVHHFLAAGRRYHRAGVQLHRDVVRDRDAEGQDGDPRDARSRPSQQGRDRPRSAWSATRSSRSAALIAEIERTRPEPRDATATARAIRELRGTWLDEWTPRLVSDEVPLSPYRVIHELMQTVDRANTIITHDAGSPRDQLSPFWIATEPLSYLGWGKTTQLGYGLGLAMGAKLARPEKLCINVWGDAAIGFTGMDFETAVRERIPILSILLNNFSMAIELKVMPVSTEKYRSTDISGDYAAMARAFGGYGERVTDPGEIAPAIRRGIEQTRAGKPALLEFITAKETRISRF